MEIWLSSYLLMELGCNIFLLMIKALMNIHIWLIFLDNSVFTCLERIPTNELMVIQHMYLQYYVGFVYSQERAIKL